MNDHDLDRLRLDCPEGHHPSRNRAERRRQLFRADAKTPPPWTSKHWTAVNRPSIYRTRA